MVFPVSFHYVSMNQNRLLLFFKVSLVFFGTYRKYCIFCVKRTQKLSMYYMQALAIKYIFMKIDFTFMCVINKQL